MKYTKLIWRDQQPYSEMFDDIYYSSDEDEAISGESEFEHVFFKHNALSERWPGLSSQNPNFVIAELGFGSGLNCILTIQKWLEFLAVNDGSDLCLHYIAIEKHPLSPQTLVELFDKNIGDVSGPSSEASTALGEIAEEVFENYPPAIETTHLRRLFAGRVVIHYKFMDVVHALSAADLKVDAWYLDGFSPAKNPQMWSESLFQNIADNSHVGTTCSTYTAAGFVRRNMQAAGFTVKKVAGHGKKREMLTAVFDDETTLSGMKFKDRPWFFSAPAIKRQSIDGERTATIIGAGIAGLSVAYALVQRGWKVSIIDRHGDVARETSANPAAIVYPRLSADNDTDTAFYMQAYVYSLYLLKKLQADHAEKFWFDNGMLQRFARQRIDKIIDRFHFDKNFIFLHDEAPGPSNKEKNSIYAEYPETGVVLPPVLAEILKQECGDKLEIIHADVSRVQHDGSWQCYQGDELVDSSDVLIIASGVSVNELNISQQAMSSFPVESIRGQMVVLNKNSCSTKISQAVNAEVYITPEIDGKYFVGGSYARDDNSTAINPDDNTALLNSLAVSYPDIFSEQDIADAWVGFRPMSKDRVPMVGAIPDEMFFVQQYADIDQGNTKKVYLPARYHQGLYLTAAHGSRAFTSCLLCGEIIAASMEGEPSPVTKAVQAYLSPSRFIVNDLKRR